MAAHGIPVSAQEMIIRRRKDRFITEIVPNVPPETHRRPPVAAANGLPDICQISITYKSHTMVKTVKVSAEIDGWRKDAERIRKVEKHLRQILMFP